MKRNTYFLVGYKVLFALLGFLAVVTEIIALVHRGTFKADNFFSFFTIESNIFAATMLLVSAWLISRPSRSLVLWRGAATLYMLITGLVFSFLLSGLEADVLTAVPWDNTVLHYIMPAAILIDWLIDRSITPLTFTKALRWLIFPLVFVGYSLIRGHLVGWYPYPFLNPADHGYSSVAVVSTGIALLTVVLTWMIIKVPVSSVYSSSKR